MGTSTEAHTAAGDNTMDSAISTTGGVIKDGKAIDPVCGMTVTIDTAKHVLSDVPAAGDTHYFCSAGCKGKFELRPELYLDPALRAETERMKAAAAGSSTFTCPMHPQIEQDHPGSCPICGMALEPKGVSLSDGPSEEYVDFRKRFVVALVLTIPLFLIAMGRHLFPEQATIISAHWLDWAELVLASLSFCGGFFPTWRNCRDGTLHRRHPTEWRCASRFRASEEHCSSKLTHLSPPETTALHGE